MVSFPIPFVGALYRIFVMCRIPLFRYNVVKQISVLPKAGNEWKRPLLNLPGGALKEPTLCDWYVSIREGWGTV